MVGWTRQNLPAGSNLSAVGTPSYFHSQQTVRHKITMSKAICRKPVIQQYGNIQFRMKIFLDTNLLIALIEKSDINLPIEYEYYTFEKCVYEFKSGIKRKFVSPDFILDNLKTHKSQKNIPDKNDATTRIAKYIMQNVLQTLQYNENELINLRNAIKRCNLYYEFGIAEEYEYIEIERDSDIGLMKNFFKKIKLFLRNYSHGIETDLSSKQINVILFEQVFGNSYEILNFREILDICYINPKDLEIVYTALSYYCRIFLTSDKPLVKECLSLGLNHCTNFVYINPENVESELLKFFQNISKSSK